MWKFPRPPRPREPVKHSEKLFESYPHATLALMSAGCGVIALGTLGLEVLTGRVQAEALNLGLGFVSVPMGVATVVLAGLVARVKLKWALPALVLGVGYWLGFIAWMMG